MIRRLWAFLAGAAWLALAAPAAAQVEVVIYGRTVDAISGVPVEGMVIFSSDTSSVVRTDSLGTFALPLRASDTLVIHSERFGYLAQQFDLTADAARKMNVLVVEPAPFVMEGIDVVTEQAITTLIDNLESRRKAIGVASRAFDRSWIDRYASGGNALDVVRAGIPDMYDCGPRNQDDICTVIVDRGATSFGGGQSIGRNTGFASGGMSGGLSDKMSNRGSALAAQKGGGWLICIDGWASLKRDLDHLPAQSISMVEVFRGGYPPIRQIRVYTAAYLVDRAHRNWTAVSPGDVPEAQC